MKFHTHLGESAARASTQPLRSARCSAMNTASSDTNNTEEHRRDSSGPHRIRTHKLPRVQDRPASPLRARPHTTQSSYPSSWSLFARLSAARSSSAIAYHPSTLSSSSISHRSSISSIFFVFGFGGARGGGGGGVRRFGCSGAMRRSALLDALASGEYAGRVEAGKGEPG